MAKSAYTLDGTGNRTSQETLFDTTHYSYDAAMRIIESMATLPGAGVEGKDNRKGNKGSKGQAQAVSNQAERYTYDIVGNRLTGPDARDSYEYAQGNMLIKDSVASYEYDTNGNLTKMQGIDWWVAYGYDYENRLTRVTDSNGMDVAYKYDPMGRRIEKNVLGQVTRYFYDSEDIAFEYNPNGTTGNIYIHGLGIDEPLGLTQTKGKYYYHADGLGSIIGITDASARLVQSYEYDSFGNLKDRKNRIKQPYAYTGREYDRETGLYYYRARYYMPEIGRFISADPIPAVNLYAYVENGPIGAIDPWGLLVEAVVWDPVGIGSSSFGHFSVRINDKSYSFGPGGMDMRPWTEYRDLNTKFRQGYASPLKLSECEEEKLEEYLKKYSSSYSSLLNNCTDPLETFLEDLGYKLYVNRTPFDLIASLERVGLVKYTRILEKQP